VADPGHTQRVSSVPPKALAAEEATETGYQTNHFAEGGGWRLAIRQAARHSAAVNATSQGRSGQSRPKVKGS